MRWISVIMLCVLPAAMPAAAEDVPAAMQFCYEDKELMPYYVGNSGEVPAQNPGISIDLMREAGRSLNLAIGFLRAPWKRCLEMVQGNKIDGVLHPSFSPDRMELGRYPENDGAVDPGRRITTQSYFLYARKGSDFAWDGKTITSLGKVVGAPRGYSVVKDLQKFEVVVEESAATTLDLSKLAAERLDAVAALEVTADTYLKKNASLFGNIEKLYPPLSSKPYYVMLSHAFVQDHPAFAERLWNEVAGLRDSLAPQLAERYLAN